MNLPNQLTSLRFLLALLVMLFLGLPGAVFKTAALATFLIASWTDWLDGRLARRNGQVTKFGKLMDPMADKFLTTAAFVTFVQLGLVAAWGVAMIVMRDLFVTGARVFAPSGGGEARLSGKQKTVLQYVFIVGVMTFLACRETAWWREEWAPGALAAIRAGMLVVVGVTLWSGFRYVLKNRTSIFG